MKNSKRLLAILCLCTIFFSSIFVYADTGPKDELKIKVINAPDELYYLDLMTTDESFESNIAQNEVDEFNSDMIKTLKEYRDGLWHSAYVAGTNIPMWGNIIGVDTGEEIIHVFGYVGLPDSTRIISVTENGTVKVSEVFKRQALQSTVTYDYKTNEVTRIPIIFSYLIQYLITCTATLLIELIVLVLFKFDFKENFKTVVTVNLATQVILTVIMGAALIKSGTVTAYILQIPVEMAIIGIEMYFFNKKLKGFTPKRRKRYAIVANLASWAVGYLLIVPVFSIISNIF